MSQPLSRRPPTEFGVAFCSAAVSAHPASHMIKHLPISAHPAKFAYVQVLAPTARPFPLAIIMA